MQKVIVVDDEVMVREPLARLLAGHEYDVVTASNGKEALQKIDGDPFPLIISDWMMPEMDGIELTRTLRRRTMGYAYVVLLTSRLTKADLVEGLEAGANDYISKPFSSDELVARLRVGERIQQLHRELSEAHARIDADLEAAARLQRAFLPPESLQVPGLSFAWKFLPCHVVSGDCLGISRLDENHVGMFLADVSGHGAAAGTLSVTISKMLTPVLGADNLVKKSWSRLPYYRIAGPAEVLNDLNLRFPMELQDALYFTICYAIVNTKKRTLRWATAGHASPLLVRPSGREEPLHGGGLPIGIGGGQVYTESCVDLLPGDRLYLYTDGVSDARNSTGEAFRNAEVARLLETLAGKPLREGVEATLREVNAWCAGKPGDDMTLLACEIGE